MTSALKRYDPNLDVRHTVEITLQQWDYQRVCTVEISAGCRGLDVLEAAIDSLHQQLPAAAHGGKTITLTAPNGGRLQCDDQEDLGREWLAEMVVSIRIVAVA